MFRKLGRQAEKERKFFSKMVCRNITAGAVWEIASYRLRQRNMNSYVQWFSKMLPLRLEEGTSLVLGIPDEFFGQLVEDCCGDFLAEALVGIEGVDYTYTFEAGHIVPVQKPVSAAVTSPAVEESAPELPEDRKESSEDQLELFSFDDDGEEIAEKEDLCHAEAGGGSAGTDEERSFPMPESRNGTQLPRWNINAATFDNFIVSDDNKGAYTAARAVADEPGVLYNPLFIYGTNGIGKTHLLQAIAHEISFQRPGRCIKCTSCSDLVNDFYRILSEHRSTMEFRDQLLEGDVLLVDDVHALAKKVQMQEDFFNVFNTLIAQGKQIVMTCDRQPCEIADIDKRLTTRFESGVICQIGMPEYEARMVILRMWRKNILTNTWLPDDVLEFLAANIRSSVRRLKSAFMTLSFHASLSGKSDLTVADAEDQLHAQIAEEITAHSISVEDIQRTVAEFFNLTIADLLGTKRTRNIAEPRMVAMALARELTPDSSTAVGAAFGRNHATILHAEKQVEQLCAKDETMRRSVAQIKRKLQK